jgi:hypothetical protein
MKTRPGFVSNSSTSNFIVGFRQVPTTVEEMQGLLFGDAVICVYDEVYSTLDIAKQVLEDLNEAEPLTETEILDEICRGWFEGCSFEIIDDAFGSPEYKRKWAEREELNRQEARSLYETRIKPYLEGRKFYCLVYGNEREPGLIAAIEHMDTFHNFIHLQISHH